MKVIGHSEQITSITLLQVDNPFR